MGTTPPFVVVVTKATWHIVPTLHMHRAVYRRTVYDCTDANASAHCNVHTRRGVSAPHRRNGKERTVPRHGPDDGNGKGGCEKNLTDDLRT